MSLWKSSLGLALLASAASPLIAQEPHPAVPTWQARWRISTTSPTPKPVTIHWALPAMCDEPTMRAATTWNNARSNFKFGTPVVSDSSEVAPESPYMLQKVYLRENDLEYNVVMRTSRDQAPTPNSSLPTIYGVIIRVNTDFIYYAGDEEGAFYCSYPDTLDSANYDYESVVFHEFGHSFGFFHGADPNCPMYPSVIKGASRRIPCADEAQSFRDLYDPNVTPY